MRITKESIKNNFRTVRAYVTKDLKTAFRFRMSIFNKFFAPVLTMLSFMVTYSAVFFASDTTDLGYVDQNNYLIYLFTGFLTYSVFRLAWGITDLRGEVGSYTLYGMLLAPSSRFLIMVGKGVRAFVEILITSLIFVVLMFFLHVQVDFMRLLVGIFAVLMLFVVFLSLDFAITAVGLVNPGLSGFITTYVPKGFLLIGCVYFPIDVIPEFARPLVFLNPLYHAVNLFRAGFMDADLHFGTELPFIYLAVLCLILPVASLFFFEFVLKKWHIRGF